MSEPKAATSCRHGNLPYSTGARVAWRLASKVVAFSKQKRKIHDNSVGVVFRHEDGKHHPFRPSSQARERDHFLVGCFLRLRSHSQLARGALLFPILLRALLDAAGQPTFLDSSRRRPWGTIRPREAAPLLAYGHRDCYLSVLLRLQHRPLEHPAGRFDPFDAAPHSV